MAKRCAGPRAFAVAGLLLAGLGTPVVAEEVSPQGLQQIRALLAEKAARTPAQRKLTTSLLYASRESRGQAMVQGLQPLRRTVDRAHVESDGMVVVDIRGDVTDELLKTIAGTGGRVVAAYPALRAVRARVPIREVETIAALPEVRRIGPKQRFQVNTGSKTSEGDVAHAADLARGTYGLDGTGVKVGVLSDGVASLAARQATGDLPATCPATPGPGACVTVVPGQAGDNPLDDEGTAMLEIVHDLAPGAKLYFATAANGEASMSENILDLKNRYGCDIIVDDLIYDEEAAFQDGVVAEAVNAVTAAGALYFSAAGNAGRLNAGTAGVWEGDFVDSQTTVAGLEGLAIHSFNGLTGGSAANSDPLTADADDSISLKWGDPLGGATADYDLVLMDSALQTIWDSSTDDQGTTGQEPLEIMGYGVAGERVVIYLYGGVVTPGQPAEPGAGGPRALRLDTHRGQLAIATRGAVYGHSGAQNTVTVAATGVASAGGGVFTGGAANPIETYSSDGPRRLFFNPNGTAITPGNVLFGTNGGLLVQKPDVAAADCVTTTTPGLTTFCGTSASAAHAAAIAALLKSAPNHRSAGQVLAAMFTTALDVNPAGRDRDAGVGIVLANPAAGALINIPAADFYTVSPCRVFDTRLAGGPTAGAALACGGDWDFTIAGTCNVPSGAKAVSLNVTVTQPSAQGNVRFFAAGAPAPLVSSLNYVAGQNRANNAIAPLSTGGAVSVRCGPSGTTHLVVDVNGYFQ
jgi:hypothetical protein